MPTAIVPRRTQAERRATTRAALLAAARELFTELGYAGTSRDDIADAAGVTRGALYHHFASKAEVAVAVIDELLAELVERVVAASRRGSGAFDRLQRGCRAYIGAAAEPAVARILLTDAPGILGQARCRELNAGFCLTLLQVALDEDADGELDVPGDQAVAASLLLAVLDEAATLVASDPHPAQARRRVGATVDVFLQRLLTPLG